MYQESNSIRYVKGVGEKSAKLYEKLGIFNVGDLLMHLPVRYESFDVPVNAGAQVNMNTIFPTLVGKTVSLICVVAGTPLLRGNRRAPIVTAKLSCDGVFINSAWFHMPYIKSKLVRGEQFVFRGKLNRNEYGYGLEQPGIYTIEEYKSLLGGLMPIYRSVNGLSSLKLRKTIKDVLENVADIGEYMPEDILEKYDLCARDVAVRTMHFPTTYNDVLKARSRLVFDEFVLFIMAVRSIREESQAKPNTFKYKTHKTADALIKTLPYSLTKAQVKVAKEIRTDLKSDKLMNRLIQGDVGSGKTILSLIALLDTAENGYQGALMAPTEVLARQHYENFVKMFARYDIPYKVELLTGSMTAKEKREAYARIKNHEVDIVVGTHALIQKGVEFDKLALVITDEQHRFGVKQRETLAEKSGENKAPHVIVMSATPIPRTLAIIIYGDLDISVLDEMPASRIPIKNCVVNQAWRPSAYKFIAGEVANGHQAYVICPKVNGDEDTEGENVVDYTEILRTELPKYIKRAKSEEKTETQTKSQTEAETSASQGIAKSARDRAGIRVEYLHGRMKPAEKNAVMEAYAKGEIDVLCSTTVIEVGVDVPNATVMMIEDAERFGLAQLHQLRGRVGRSDLQSYCIFINGSGDEEKQKRLDILNHSNDGFKIASEDLKLRGPGDVFGIRQSGELAFEIGDIFTDSTILKDASDAADELRERKDLPEIFTQKIDDYINKSLEGLSL